MFLFSTFFVYGKKEIKVGSIIKDDKLYIVLEYCPLGDLNKF